MPRDIKVPNTNHYLKFERQLKGWSQVYLAKQIEVPDYYISRWERGEVTPSPYYQQKLCDLFGKTAEELGFLQPKESNLLSSSTLSAEKAFSESTIRPGEPEGDVQKVSTGYTASVHIPYTQHGLQRILSLIIVVIAGEILFFLYLALWWYLSSKKVVHTF